MSIVSEAILSGHLEEARRLVLNGADPNEQDRYGYTPLIEAIIVEETALVQFLIEHGARVNDDDIAGCTPLHWAADYALYGIMEMLLKHGADPNRYSADGLPILVNPLLRKQTELVNLLLRNGAQLELAQDYIDLKLLAHRFELRGYADLVDANGLFFEFDVEGFFLEFSLHCIGASYERYAARPHPSHPLQARFNQAAHRVLAGYQVAYEIMKRKLSRRRIEEDFALDDLLEAPFYIVPVSFQGHAVTLLKYRNYFAKCDRGVKRLSDTVIISEVTKPLAWNASLVKELLLENKDEHFMHTTLKKRLGLKPLATLPSRYQIAGNCSWANVEASIPTALWLLFYQPEQTPTEQTQLKKEVMKYYTDWIEWERDEALEAFLKGTLAASNARKAARIALLAALLLQRAVSLKPIEIKRAKKIMPFLLEPQHRYILDAYLHVYLSPRSGQLGVQFMRLLERCGFPVQSTSPAHPGRAQSNHQGEWPHRVHSPLHAAARSGDRRQLQQALEQLQMDVDLQDETGSTALMYAAFRGDTPMVDYLLKRGADPAIRNHKNGSALDYAVFAKQVSVIERLLKASHSS